MVDVKKCGIFFDGIYFFIFKLLLENLEVWLNVIKNLEGCFDDVFIIVFFWLGKI